jgi:hypothetical protein
VLEHLEGETLAERLAKVRSLDRVPAYAIEISDALDKAHRKDHPPRPEAGNIMLTKSGMSSSTSGVAKRGGTMRARRLPVRAR